MAWWLLRIDLRHALYIVQSHKHVWRGSLGSTDDFITAYPMDSLICMVFHERNMGFVDGGEPLF